MNLHSTKKHLKHSVKFEHAENVRGLNVIECKLCHIPALPAAAAAILLLMLMF